MVDHGSPGAGDLGGPGGGGAARRAPAVPGATGGAFRELLDGWHGHVAADDAFEANATAAREAVSADLDEDPWRA